MLLYFHFSTVVYMTSPFLPSHPLHNSWSHLMNVFKLLFHQAGNSQNSYLISSTACDTRQSISNWIHESGQYQTVANVNGCLHFVTCENPNFDTSFCKSIYAGGPLPAVCPQLLCTQVESNLSQSVPQPTITELFRITMFQSHTQLKNQKSFQLNINLK
jgi:hypothetical protein